MSYEDRYQDSHFNILYFQLMILQVRIIKAVLIFTMKAIIKNLEIYFFKPVRYNLPYDLFSQ